MTAFGGRQPTPFRQAIIESGAVGPGVATQYDAKDFMDTVTAAGCNYRDPDSFMSLECLRSLSLESLLDVELAVGASQSAFIDGLEAFGPVVDGDFIPDAPSRLVQSGRFVETPLIIGWNHDDGSLFTPTSIATQQDVSKLLVKYFPALTKQTLNHILSLYPVSDFSAIPSANVTAQWSRASRIFRDMQFTCPSLFLATHLGDSHQSLPANAKYHPVAKSKANTLQRILSPQQSQSSSVFIYELNQTSFAENLTAQGFPQLGISHIADIPYVFDEVARFNRSASNIRLAKQVTGSWSRFAATGSPSSVKGVSLKGWEPAWKSQANDRLQNARVMVIGGGKPGLSGLEGDEDALQEERLPERCGFLMSEKVIREIGT